MEYKTTFTTSENVRECRTECICAIFEDDTQRSSASREVARFEFRLDEEECLIKASVDLTLRPEKIKFEEAFRELWLCGAIKLSVRADIMSLRLSSVKFEGNTTSKFDYYNFAVSPKDRETLLEGFRDPNIRDAIDFLLEHRGRAMAGARIAA